MIPDETRAAPPAAGHNSQSLRTTAVAEQLEALQPYAARRDEFVAWMNRHVVRDRATAGDATDTIKLANECWDLIEAQRLEHSNRYRDTANAIKNVTDEFWQECFDAMDALKRRADAWKKAEDDRIQGQRDEQEKIQAQLRAAANVPAPAPTAATIPARRKPIRGDLGGKLTTTVEKTYAIEDLKLIPMWVLETETVKNAILAVAKAMAKHHPNIPGITVTTGDKSRFS